jgi:hypothetical protein
MGEGGGSGQRHAPGRALIIIINNNPWRYSSDETWPADQLPLAVFPDCTRRYWVDMWLAHRIPQLHFQLSKPDRYFFIQVTIQFIRSRGWVDPVPSRRLQGTEMAVTVSQTIPSGIEQHPVLCMPSTLMGLCWWWLFNSPVLVKLILKNGYRLRWISMSSLRKIFLWNQATMIRFRYVRYCTLSEVGDYWRNKTVGVAQCIWIRSRCMGRLVRSARSYW